MMKTYLPLIAAISAAPLLAQHAPDRHPLYDAAAPAQEVKQPAATQLKLAVMSDTHITTDMDMKELPAQAPTKVKLSGWRGERCSFQLVVQANGAAKNLRVSTEPLAKNNISIPFTASMVRYTKAAGKVVADIIGDEN
ncbi:MAG: hypothetical protein MJ058_03395, partial [Akkermansia sp.]|nr:hypothetical protein [Akkermansia sp.]